MLKCPPKTEISGFNMKNFKKESFSGMQLIFSFLLTWEVGVFFFLLSSVIFGDHEESEGFWIFDKRSEALIKYDISVLPSSATCTALNAQAVYLLIHCPQSVSLWSLLVLYLLFLKVSVSVSMSRVMLQQQMAMLLRCIPVPEAHTPFPLSVPTVLNEILLVFAFVEACT